MCLAVIAYRKRNFRAMGVSRALLRSGTLERDVYAQVPRWVEKGNIAWDLLKPVYGLDTAGNDLGGNMRNILAKECVGGTTPIDKSVLFWTKKIEYEYGVGFRDQNTSSSDQGILKVNENFETGERRKVIGPISIHVDGILVPRSGMFIEYITQRMKENPKLIDMEKMNRPIWGW